MHVAREVAVIHSFLQREQGSSYSTGSDVPSTHECKRQGFIQRTLLACGITMTTQLTGFHVIPFYSTTILGVDPGLLRTGYGEYDV